MVGGKASNHHLPLFTTSLTFVILSEAKNLILLVEHNRKKYLNKKIIS